MRGPFSLGKFWWSIWVVLALAGATVIVRADIAQRRETFQADARTAHRLLSQRAAAHDAVLATLALLHPGGAARSESRLPAVHPQVIAGLRRDGDRAWPDADLRAAEAVSRAQRRAAAGPIDSASGQFTLVLAGDPSSYALRIDLARMVPWDDWPLQRAGPVRVALAQGDAVMLLQPGRSAGAQPAGLTSGFVFSKLLAVPSQPFELRLHRATGPAEWPWPWLTAWWLLTALAVAGVAAWQRGRQARRRAEDLLRVGQVARLNTMGELAGGMAHELNQPLTAMLANTQAARRLLDDDPPALADARDAMQQAALQARRAADVVARLRRQLVAPDRAPRLEPVPLRAATRQGFDLLAPQMRQRRIAARFEGQETLVLADPVALEQIVHNLLHNAMRALDGVPVSQRILLLRVGATDGRGCLIVRDHGSGIDDDSLARLFEPFFTTRQDGLGLGLSLSRSLAEAMHGTLDAAQAAPRGAEFRLALPLALAQSAP